jgi:hypothetical protein
VTAAEDKDASNNALTRKVTVGTLPDLSVSVGTPRHPGSTTQSQKSPLPPAIAIAAAGISLGAYAHIRKKDGAGTKTVPLLVIALLLTAGLPAFVPAADAADTTSLYLIPVTVKNNGGSDASAFAVTIYLDGEKIATKSFEDGIPAGNEVKADIPIHTTPGTHAIKVVVDEAARIQDGNRQNNVAELSYAFP